jgi:hypothetical protein
MTWAVEDRVKNHNLFEITKVALVDYFLMLSRSIQCRALEVWHIPQWLGTQPVVARPPTPSSEESELKLGAQKCGTCHVFFFVKGMVCYTSNLQSGNNNSHEVWVR